MTQTNLIAAAISAMQQAYAPYSGFQVGAALLTKSGKIFMGSNIENASYGGTVCAERTAFFSAVHSGEREFQAIAIVGGKDGILREFAPPCGICRQVMREFCDDSFEIILHDGSKAKAFTLADLLPFSFGPEKLNRTPPIKEESPCECMT